MKYIVANRNLLILFAPTFVTDVAPEHQRGEILGQMASASTLSFACGPLLGVYVYARFGFLD